ncbi:MAG: hypothetical protein IKB38_02680 [Clostridia bacterium]|nr:hypothetical protein [Clostridia bacterium]
MAYNTTYDNLYENLKNRFTVENDNFEYTLGEYMLAKANEIDEVSSLPVSVNDNAMNKSLVLSIASFVNEKLTIKKAPVKDKTLRSFPFRTTVASLLSAFLLCTIVVTYGLLGNSSPATEAETANASYEVENIDSFEDIEATDTTHQA